MIQHSPYVATQMENNEDIPYDLSYDDMDAFVRSCGVVLECDSRDESSLRIMSY
jgi:hypothetical protein